jgi:hypothetical protein
MGSRIIRIARQVKHIWDELDYAQRRLFEIRTGIPCTSHGERGCARAEVVELEGVLALRHPEDTPALDPSLQDAA